MRILLNYDEHLSNHKGTLAGILKSKGYTAFSTGRTLTISELLTAAKSVHADGILLANESTLNNLVNSSYKVSLDKYRGSRLNYSIPVIVGAPIDHPRKVKHGRWLYEKDIDKFKQIKTPVVQLQYTVCSSRELLDACLEKASKALIISTDIETDSSNRITCVGYSLLNPNLTTTSFLIPYVDFGKDHWENDDDYGYAIETQRTISKLPIAKLYFNGIYDAQYQITYHAEPNNFVLDGMALAHAEFSELPKSLDFVASLHLHDYYFWKDDADESRKKGDIHTYWAYCARDSWNTLRSFINQIRNAKPYAFRNYKELFKMVYPYIYCAFEGCALEQKTLLENTTKATSIAESAKQSLCKMAATENFNPASPKQVAILLFDIIGAKPVAKPRKKKDGTWTSKRGTDEKTLAKIAEQHPLLSIFVSRLLEYREQAKAIGTYFKFNQWWGRDECQLSQGRMLYGINPFGTDTGRAASNASSFRLYDLLREEIRSYGTQIQNVPPYAKNMLISDIGFELGEADNNKSEARCVGYLSNCIALIKALEDRTKDFYKVLGTIFFGLLYEAVSNELRNKVLKRIVHGRNYLMGADTFVETVGSKQLYEGARLLNYKLTTLKAFAEYLLNLYNKPFPEVTTWYNEIKLEIVRNHTLTSPLGYTRYFFGDIIKDHKVFRNAVAHAPQNLSVMILNKGVWNVYNRLVLTQNGLFRLKAQIHDSIFWQSPPEKRAEYDAIVLECMNNPVVIKGRTMSIPVDIKHGQNWLELKQ